MLVVFFQRRPLCNLKRNYIVIFRINYVFSHQIFLFDTRIFLFIHFSNIYNIVEYIFLSLTL